MLILFGLSVDALCLRLSSVFSTVFGSSTGTKYSTENTGIFKRFKKQWSKMDQNIFIPASDSHFCTPELLSLHAQLLI